MQGGISGDTGAKGEETARVLEKIIFFHIAEDENTSLGRWVSFDILRTEM